MGGKITLINSVLNALPIYLLSFFKIPQKVINRLVKLQRNFLWGGDQDNKKIPWVKWDIVCLPKCEGGLGIKDIAKFNTALLGKWIWALASDHQQLWVRIINSKYGGWEALQSTRAQGRHSGWWRGMIGMSSVDSPSNEEEVGSSLFLVKEITHSLSLVFGLALVALVLIRHGIIEGRMDALGSIAGV